MYGCIHTVTPGRSVHGCSIYAILLIKMCVSAYIMYKPTLHTDICPYVRLSFMNNYPYTPQLMSLHACDNSIAGLPMLLSEQSKIISPVNPQFWEDGLATHPDREFAPFSTQGLQYGFRIGFQTDIVQLRSARANHQSVVYHLGVLSQYFDREVQTGRITELPNALTVLGVQISPLGLIPKKGRPSK